VAILAAEGKAGSTLVEQKALADAALYTAEQEAAAKLLLAKAESESISYIGQMLLTNPAFIDYLKAKGWADAGAPVPGTIVGSDSVFPWLELQPTQ